MKYDNYHIFEMDMTSEEFETISKFCDCMDEYLDWIDDYDHIIDIMREIARGNEELSDKHVRINIVD